MLWKDVDNSVAWISISSILILMDITEHQQWTLEENRIADKGTKDRKLEREEKDGNHSLIPYNYELRQHCLKVIIA